MSKIVVLGAGISGHVAASHLRRKLSKEHEVVVVSPNSNYQWIPSNIWVGIGRMKSKKILFPLAPLYKRKASVTNKRKHLPFIQKVIHKKINLMFWPNMLLETTKGLKKK